MSRWMYRVMYRVGFTPWEADAALVGGELDELLLAEEGERTEPYGASLDLGCGTGTWSIKLAQRGWRAVGIDLVPRAIESARKRAREADVDATFVEGDVTALRSSGVGEGFSFVLDVECFNHLSDGQRELVGREVNAVTTTDATMLVLVWTRARRGPLPPGAQPDDLVSAFPGWEIVAERAYAGDLPRPLRSIAPHWYRLARRSVPPSG